MRPKHVESALCLAVAVMLSGGAAGAELPEQAPRSLPAPAAVRGEALDPRDVPPEDESDEIERRGFTLQLSLGAGIAHIAPHRGVDYERGGLGGLNLMLGGFLTPDVALVAKLSGVNWGPWDDDVEVGIAGGAGPAVQWWANDHFNMVVGAGLGVLSVGDEDVDHPPGFAALAGLNIVPFALDRHGFGISLDFVPVFTEKGHALTFQGGLSWQYY